MDAFRLDGKVVIIAGASSGMGARAAEILSDAGAKVYILARRENRLKELTDKINAAGGSCAYSAADVSDEAACKAAVGDCVAQFGRVDGLVFASGIEGKHTLLDPITEQLDVENGRAVMNVNYFGFVAMAKYCIEEMQKVGGGSIVAIGSAAAIKTRCGEFSYSASKGAMRTAARVIGALAGPLNIRCNSILPGLVATEISEEYLKNTDFVNEFLKGVPIGKVGTTDDIGNCILYLVSDASKWMTGQEIVLDGGMIC